MPPIVPPTLTRAKDHHLDALIGHWPEGLPIEAGALSACHAALVACRTAWRRSCETADAIARDELVTPLARQQRSRKFLDGRMAAVLPLCDAARAVADRQVLALRRSAETKLVARDSSPRAVALEGEIRGWLRGMAPKERGEALGRALAALDHQTLAAVLNAPAPLTGLDAGIHGNWRQRWLAAVAKDELAEIADLERAAAICTGAGEALLRRRAESFDHPTLDAAEGRSRAAVAAEGAA
jgi:hypothetical protein